MIDIARVLTFKGFSGWSMPGNSLDRLNWPRENGKRPTMTDIEAWAAEMEAAPEVQPDALRDGSGAVTRQELNDLKAWLRERLR